MSSSDRPSSGKRDWSGAVSIALTLLTSGAIIVARFSALEEAKQIQTEEIRLLKSKVEELQRNNTLLERIHRIELESSELHSAVSGLREELRELRAKRR